MKDDPVIDVHAHVFPRPALALADTVDPVPWIGGLVGRDGDGGAPVLVTDRRRVVFGSSLHFAGVQRRLERMDEIGIDVQMVSVLPPFFRYELPSEVGIEAARAINDDIADLCGRWPDRFMGLATLPMQDPAASVMELRRATEELGLVGASIGTHVNGTNLDAPELFSVFEAFASSRAFVFVHPDGNRAVPPTLSSYYLNNLIGNPWETTVAIASLVFGGVLERLPDLTLCFAHGGGYAPFAAGRFRHGFLMRREPQARISTPPRELMRRIYVDSLVHDDVAVRYLIDTMGVSNVVLGSDFPADMGPQEPVREINCSTRLATAEKQAILGGNAVRLLRELGRM